MVKALMLDADGVAIKGAKKFSSRFVQEFGAPKDVVSAFFEHDFPLCLVGRKDLREELEKRLTDWGWKGSVDELLSYWFADGSEKHPDVLSFSDEIRRQGIPCYLASNQDAYRARYLWENLKLNAHFDGHFFSSELGHKKSDPEFFEKVLAQLEGVQPEEILYWDDDEECVDAALAVGIKAYYFDGFDYFLGQTEDLLK
jgi:putative hydrolase of the HAD superfamily